MAEHPGRNDSADDGSSSEHSDQHGSDEQATASTRVGTKDVPGAGGDQSYDESSPATTEEHTVTQRHQDTDTEDDATSTAHQDTEDDSTSTSRPKSESENGATASNGPATTNDAAPTALTATLGHGPPRGDPRRWLVDHLADDRR